VTCAKCADSRHRDAWEKAESLSKIFAAVFIPVVLGVASLLANQALEKSKTRDELLKQAIDVVFLSKSDQMAGSDKSFESRRAHRSHWLEIYNSLADVKLSQEFIAVMMEQDTRVDGTELYAIENRPSLIANTERAESKNEDQLGHGWVAVGRLNSERYSDVNFTVPPKATNRDGTIKPEEIIRARWSVSLRSNSRNLEDRTATANRLILAADERSLQVGLVRLDWTVPVAGCVGGRDPCPSTSTQRAAAQIPEAIGVR
jgi:hypothetical protein